VLDRSSPPALLDSYETERRPIAEYNAEQSLQNAMRLLEVPQALGCSDDRAASRRNFDRGLADAAWRRGVATAIEHQAEHFDMLGLQLGYSYEQGALVPDGTSKPAVANPVRQFVPSSRPGARLPHGWLRRNGNTCSSLDLIPLDRLTLIAGPRGATWLEAADRLGAAMKCLRIGVDIEDPDGWWASAAGMRDDGALLVRPDQHVAFRSPAASGDPRAILQRAVDAALGREA
jgi:2,4-dichlorophenol 6-monooxygenase